MARIFTRQEVRKHKMKYQVFAGMADFLGILLGLIVIALCIFLLVTLIHWAINGFETAFATLWDMFMSAIIIPE